MKIGAGEVHCWVGDHTDPLQVGWISYREGGAIVNAKVIRGKKSGNLFVSHITAYRKGATLPAVLYDDDALWHRKAACLLEHFRAKFPSIR